MLGIDLSFQDVVLIVLGIFVAVAFLWLFVSILIDVFRSKDLAGWAKALWVLGLVLVPFGGSLAYLVVRGDSMSDRYLAVASKRVREEAHEQRVDAVDRVAMLAEMRDKGTLTDDEFDRLKRSIIDSA